MRSLSGSQGSSATIRKKWRHMSRVVAAAIRESPEFGVSLRKTLTSPDKRLKCTAFWTTRKEKLR